MIAVMLWLSVSDDCCDAVSEWVIIVVMLWVWVMIAVMLWQSVSVCCVVILLCSLKSSAKAPLIKSRTGLLRRGSSFRFRWLIMQHIRTSQWFISSVVKVWCAAHGTNDVPSHDCIINDASHWMTQQTPFSSIVKFCHIYVFEHVAGMSEMVWYLLSSVQATTQNWSILGDGQIPSGCEILSVTWSLQPEAREAVQKWQY